MSKTTLTCGKCKEAWICERHPDLPWPHDWCPMPAMRLPLVNRSRSDEDASAEPATGAVALLNYLTISLDAEHGIVLNPSLTPEQSPEGLRGLEETHRLVDIVCLHCGCASEAPVHGLRVFEHWVTTVPVCVQVCEHETSSSTFCPMVVQFP